MQKLTTSLIDLIKTEPAIGWTRSGGANSNFGRLYGINDCLRDALRLASDCERNDTLEVLHFGLDMGIASDYVGEIVRTCTAGTIDYKVLVMGESERDFGSATPDEVLNWATYVPASIRRIRKHIANFAATTARREQTTKVEIRQYGGVPLFHGLAFRGARNVSYVSMCHFREPDHEIYDWGELAYRMIVPGLSTASDLHLAKTVEGLFRHTWATESKVRWRFESAGNIVDYDEFT